MCNIELIFLVVIEDLLTRDWLVTSWISDCLNSRMFADSAKEQILSADNAFAAISAMSDSVFSFTAESSFGSTLP